MPPQLEYPPAERLPWLDSYQQSHLQRDLADLARDASLPVTSVRRYLRYLELSYQSLRLPPWSTNAGARLIKAPKLIWVDAGVQRALSGQVSGLSGEQYENLITAQILTTLWSLGVRFNASYLRTAGGLEINLLLEGEDGGIVACELKSRATVQERDARRIERARGLLGEKYRGGVVVYRGSAVQRLSETVYCVPDWVLLGTPYPVPGP